MYPGPVVRGQWGLWFSLLTDTMSETPEKGSFLPSLFIIPSAGCVEEPAEKQANIPPKQRPLPGVCDVCAARARETDRRTNGSRSTDCERRPDYFTHASHSVSFVGDVWKLSTARLFALKIKLYLIFRVLFCRASFF